MVKPIQGYTPDFTRPARSTTFRPITTLFEVQFDRIVAMVSDAAEKAVNRTANMAFRTADARVPVRKAFRGGRQSVRTLSMAELKNEMPQFRRVLTRRASRSVSTNDVPTYRVGVQTVTHRNRANLWKDTAEARAIRLDPNTGRWRLADISNINPDTGMARFYSDREEQYRLRQLLGRYTEQDANGKLRLKVRQSEIFGAGNQGYIGGSLKHSIRKRSDVNSLVSHYMSIVAGGKTAPYAKFVEFGTRHAPAQPFLRPAMKTAENRYRAIMMQELGKIGTAG